MMIHIVSFLVMLLIGLFFPFWLFALAALVYACVFRAYELLVLSACIDALFGDPAQGAWYLYTGITALIILCAILMKPHLRFYQ
jgi:hypothetical protein